MKKKIVAMMLAGVMACEMNITLNLRKNPETSTHWLNFQIAR